MMSIADAASILHLFEQMLLAMEQRLVAKMDDNSRLASERWSRHDIELEADRRLANARFEKIEAAILTVETSLKSHLQREHEEDLIIEARVRPVKTIFGWLWLHWRDLLLLAIGLVAAATFIIDYLGHMFGPGI